MNVKNTGISIIIFCCTGSMPAAGVDPLLPDLADAHQDRQRRKYGSCADRS